MKIVKTILGPLLTLTICLLFIGKWTSGFDAFTVFSYTLKTAGETPREVPNFELINQEGEEFSLKENNKYLLLNFVYLNCPQVCHKINNRLEDIYHSSLSQFIPTDLELLTISFDMQNDHVEKIRNYRKFFGEDPVGWNFALPRGVNKERLDILLSEIGIWAKKTPNRPIINHSVYIFLISPKNEIIQVFDPGLMNNDEIISAISTCIQKENNYAKL